MSIIAGKTIEPNVSNEIKKRSIKAVDASETIEQNAIKTIKV